MVFKKSNLAFHKRHMYANATVCILYVLTAKLGLMLALPPGVATPLWPPSGLALAAVLLFDCTVKPGIFLGSFIVNSLISPLHWPFSMLLSCAIAFGSTLQACLAGWALRKFKLVQDLLNRHHYVFYFFCIALASCLISSLIGTASLYASHLIDTKDLFNTWITWWLGDSTGMIVFAPIALVWAPPYISKPTKKQLQEALPLLALLIIASLLTFGGIFHTGYPIEYILIPCLLIAAFRLGAQLTTLMLMIVIIIAIWGTSQAQGPFAQSSLNESLLLLQSFIAIVSATILILLAVLEELHKAQTLLLEANKDLELKVIERTSKLTEKTQQLEKTTLQLRDLTILLHQKNQLLEKTLEEFKLTQKHALFREKLASLGDLTSGLAHQMRNPLNFVINLAELSSNSLTSWINTLKQKTLLEANTITELSTALSQASQNLKKIDEHGRKANAIIETMIKHAQGTTEIYETLHLHAFLDHLVNISYQSRKSRESSLEIQFHKHYDISLDTIYTIPQDLSRALVNILDNAYDAISEKQRLAASPYTPTITLATSELEDTIVIRIQDNGVGIPEENLNKIFTPFFTTKTSGSAGFGLSITYDLIVEHLGGEIKVESTPGEYAEFILILPKQPQTARLKKEI